MQKNSSFRNPNLCDTKISHEASALTGKHLLIRNIHIFCIRNMESKMLKKYYLIQKLKHSGNMVPISRLRQARNLLWPIYKSYISLGITILDSLMASYLRGTIVSTSTNGTMVQSYQHLQMQYKISSFIANNHSL